LDISLGDPQQKQYNIVYPDAPYGIFTYIWAIFAVNVGKYSIHGASGIM
jgi:hypothetical protein